MTENKASSDVLIARFVAESDRLSRILGSYYIEPVQSRTTLNLMRRDSSLSDPAYYKSIYARIDPISLDVYSASGKKIRGNLHNSYGGFDLIDSEGVIVVPCRLVRRLKELQTS